MAIDRGLAKRLGIQLRIDSIRCTTEAGSGHPTSSMSAADLIAVLLVGYLRYDWRNPSDLSNDRLIFSKGHASPLLYSMYKAAGAISDRELLSLRKFGSPLEGHPKPRKRDDSEDGQGLPWVDIATGSLGQGLPAAIGMGLVGKAQEGEPFRIWVLVGDSEMAEGSVWEGFDKAGHYALNNVIAIVDVNRLGQQGPTELGWDTAKYAARVKAFGWNVIEIDGHDVSEIDAAFAKATSHTGKPTCIMAKTVKGSGVSFLENKEGWHGKALSKDEAVKAIDELGGRIDTPVHVQRPTNRIEAPTGEIKMPKLPTYKVGGLEATRRAFGEALEAIGKAVPQVCVLDGEVSNSTYTDSFKRAVPERFYEMYISEQQLVSAALGMSVLGKITFAATFAAFWTRAFDQIRMAAVSGADLRLCGSHVGVSIGEDGPSQMGLEDIAMMRAIHGSTVLYPCDANQTVQLVKEMVTTPGISYLRTTRGKTPVIYETDETFPIGGSKMLRRSEHDQLTIVAAGITLHESLKAYDQLNSENIHVRVIDMYSIKPIDNEALRMAAQETQGRILVVEDHWAEGGLGDAVLDAFADSGETLASVTKLAVRAMPSSGTPGELLAAAGIDADHIVQTARASLLTRQVRMRPRQTVHLI